MILPDLKKKIGDHKDLTKKIGKSLPKEINCSD